MDSSVCAVYCITTWLDLMLRIVELTKHVTYICRSNHTVIFIGSNIWEKGSKKNNNLPCKPMYDLITYKVLSQVRICRRPSPPDVGVAILTWKMHTVLNRIYFLSYGWLYLEFTVPHQVCHRQQKSYSKVAKFTGKMRIALTIIL